MVEDEKLGSPFTGELAFVKQMTEGVTDGTRPPPTRFAAHLPRKGGGFYFLRKLCKAQNTPHKILGWVVKNIFSLFY